MLRPRKCALPWMAPPTVPGVPAQASMPARPWPTVQRTRPLIVSPGAARTPCSSSCVDRRDRARARRRRERRCRDQHVRAAAEHVSAAAVSRARSVRPRSAARSLRASTRYSAGPPTWNVVKLAAARDVHARRRSTDRRKAWIAGGRSRDRAVTRYASTQRERSSSAASSLSWMLSKPPFDITTIKIAAARLALHLLHDSPRRRHEMRGRALSPQIGDDLLPATAACPRRCDRGTPPRAPLRRPLEARRRNPSGTPSGMMTRSAARRWPRCAASDARAAAPRSSRRSRSDDARSRRRPRIPSTLPRSSSRRLTPAKRSQAAGDRARCRGRRDTPTAIAASALRTLCRPSSGISKVPISGRRALHA